jgi:hypothetical protein
MPHSAVKQLESHKFGNHDMDIKIAVKSKIKKNKTTFREHLEELSTARKEEKTIHEKRREERLMTSIAEAFMMMGTKGAEGLVCGQGTIEKRFGYDVIDHKNYKEIEPERQTGLDFFSSSKTGNVALIPVLSKIE